MAIIYFDGFDHYNNGFGPGGRKWNQGSAASIQPGRFSGSSIATNGSGNGFVSLWDGANISFTPSNEIIVGFAMRLDSALAFTSTNHHPFLMFMKGTTVQCSLWVDPTSGEIVVRSGRGQLITDDELGTTNFVPPLTLWFYLEVKMLCGNPGSFEIMVNGTSKCVATGVQTDQVGTGLFDKVALCSLAEFGPSIFVDDFYIIDTTIATGSTDFLGEVRVQTKYPDADGYQNDFTPSTGVVNANNANAVTTYYAETGLYNYSGVVGAIDLYSVGNFTVSGTIFAVQESLSFRKDDVGNRSIRPLMRAASNSTNYQGASFPCYSSYTHAGKIWELDPSTGVAWTLTDLNNTEFGIKIDS